MITVTGNDTSKKGTGTEVALRKGGDGDRDHLHPHPPGGGDLEVGAEVLKDFREAELPLRHRRLQEMFQVLQVPQVLRVRGKS